MLLRARDVDTLASLDEVPIDIGEKITATFNNAVRITGIHMARRRKANA